MRLSVEHHEISRIKSRDHLIITVLDADNPLLFTAAINQLTFVPGLANSVEYKWVKERKIIYIPKKSAKTYPSDFRPLSMLEVLYKIPS